MANVMASARRLNIMKERTRKSMQTCMQYRVLRGAVE